MTTDLASTQSTFGSRFAGALIGPDHPDYDEVRKICNGMIGKRPALIARCTTPQDVQAALAHARVEGLVVAVCARRALDAGALLLRRRDRERHRPDEGHQR